MLCHGDTGTTEFCLTSDLVTAEGTLSFISSQYFIILCKASIAFGDYWFSGNRKGADQILANKITLNNNLFRKNLQSLVDNFNVLNRKFTQEEIRLFNERAIGIRSNIDLADRKWIFNP